MSRVCCCLLFATLFVFFIYSADAKPIEEGKHLQVKEFPKEYVHSREKRTIKTTAKIIGAVGAAKANIAKFALLKMGLKAAIGKISAALATVGKIGKVGLGIAAGAAAAKALGYVVSQKFSSFHHTENDVNTDTWSNNIRR